MQNPSWPSSTVSCGCSPDTEQALAPPAELEPVGSAQQAPTQDPLGSLFPHRLLQFLCDSPALGQSRHCTHTTPSLGFQFNRRDHRQIEAWGTLP